MSLYPTNPFAGQTIQSSVDGNHPDLGYIAHYRWSAPAAASQTNVLAATTLADGATTTVTTGITNPVEPRAVQIKGNASGITGNVIVTGTNINDEAITDTIAASGASAVAGTKAFKTITSIQLPARTTAGDTISLGTLDILGLPYKLSHNTVLKTFLNNALEGTAPTVTVSATALESNTIDLNSALNGNPVDVYLIV